MLIKAGILSSGSKQILFCNDKRVFLKCPKRPAKYYGRLEFIKSLSDKELDRDKIKIFNKAIRHDNINIISYLKERNITFTKQELFGFTRRAVEEDKFDLFRSICEIYSYYPEETVILENIFRYGRPEDLDFAFQMCLFDPYEDETYHTFLRSIKYGNLEIIKHYDEFLPFDNQRKNQIIAKSQHRKVYDYLLSQGADKIMISNIEKNTDINFIKYLYNLGLKLESSYLIDILEYERSIEIIDFLISKGHKFKELDKALADNETISNQRSALYLLKLGYAKDYHFKNLDRHSFLIKEATLEDFDLVKDLIVEDGYNKEIVDNKDKDIVKCYIYLNREMFERWPKVIKECSEFYTTLYIKKSLQSI